MKVFLKTEGYGKRQHYRRLIDMNSMEDYDKMITQMTSYKNAWVNGIRVMKNGSLELIIHNRRVDILSILQFDPMDCNVDWEAYPWPA